MSSDVAKNYIEVLEEVKSINPNAQLVCVSKTKPISDLIEVFQVGGTVFGENYVHEILEKAPLLPEAKFHMIGPVQGNKIPKLAALPNLEMVQTIDNSGHALRLSSKRPQDLPRIKVLIQVNTSEEPSKNGLSDINEIVELIKYIRSDCPMLEFRGLMTIGEIGEPERDFTKLIEVRNIAAASVGDDPLSYDLSMGMSADYTIALKNGASIVRVGSKIFGPRIYNK